MTVTNHPSYIRLRARAQGLGSRATTVRGLIRALRGRSIPPPQPLTRAQWEAAQRDRALRGRYRDPDAHAADVLTLLHEIQTELDRVQRRCSVRCLDLYEVLDHIVHQTITERVYVASSYGYRYTWTSAGAVLDDTGTVVRWGVGRVSAQCETPVAEHSVPLRTVRGIAWGSALLPGDAIAVAVGTGNDRHYIRYAWDGTRTGVACRMPEDLRSRFGGWEHAATIDGLRDEIARKRAILAEEVRRKKESARRDRRARLFARLSRTPLVTYDIMRSVGACDAGIRAWAQAHGYPLDARVSLAEIARDQSMWALRAAKHILAASRDQRDRASRAAKE